jgi:hypothetical protein
MGWITAALAAAAATFGPNQHGAVKVTYEALPHQAMGYSSPPRTIVLDTSPMPIWLKQCVIVHEYGHLRGRYHSRNPGSIMYWQMRADTCQAFRARHGLR